MHSFSFDLTETRAGLESGRRVAIPATTCGRRGASTKGRARWITLRCEWCLQSHNIININLVLDSMLIPCVLQDISRLDKKERVSSCFLQVANLIEELQALRQHLDEGEPAQKATAAAQLLVDFSCDNMQSCKCVIFRKWRRLRQHCWSEFENDCFVWFTNVHKVHHVSGSVAPFSACKSGAKPGADSEGAAGKPPGVRQEGVGGAGWPVKNVKTLKIHWFIMWSADFIWFLCKVDLSLLRCLKLDLSSKNNSQHKQQEPKSAGGQCRYQRSWDLRLEKTGQIPSSSKWKKMFAPTQLNLYQTSLNMQTIRWYLLISSQSSSKNGFSFCFQLFFQFHADLFQVQSMGETVAATVHEVRSNESLTEVTFFCGGKTSFFVDFNWRVWFCAWLFLFFSMKSIFLLWRKILSNPSQNSRTRSISCSWRFLMDCTAKSHV